jgi:hypothetical protein
MLLCQALENGHYEAPALHGRRRDAHQPLDALILERHCR